jgi:CRP-like cAMP-binding protein
MISTAILLSQLPFFAGMSPNMLAPLQAACRSVKLERGEVLFRRGDRGKEMFIIESGAIRIWIDDEKGREIHLATLGENQIIGELEIIDGKPRSASAQATEPTLLIALPRDAFFEQIGNYPGMAIQLLTALSERLRHNNEMQVQARGVVAPDERLANLLRMLHSNSPNGEIKGFNIQNIAHLLDIDVPDVQRILEQWQRDGSIQFVNDNTLAVRQPAALQPIGAVRR